MFVMFVAGDALQVKLKIQMFLKKNYNKFQK